MINFSVIYGATTPTLVNKLNTALKKIQEYLNQKLSTNREIKKIPSSTYMYSRLSIKGVLIECGFLSNNNERTKLLDEEYLNQFANYLAEACLNIYSKTNI